MLVLTIQKKITSEKFQNVLSRLYDTEKSKTCWRELTTNSKSEFQNCLLQATSY